MSIWQELQNRFSYRHFRAVKSLRLPVKSQADAEVDQPVGSIVYNDLDDAIEYKAPEGFTQVGGGEHHTAKAKKIPTGTDATERLLEIVSDTDETLRVVDRDILIEGDVDYGGKKIQVDNGKKIIIDAGAILTNVYIDASPDAIIFTGAGSVELLNDEVHARWFGMDPQFDIDLGVTGYDNKIAIDATFAATKEGGEVKLYGTKGAFFGSGAYHGKLFYYSARITVPKRLKITGCGKEQTVLIGPGFLYPSNVDNCYSKDFRTVANAVSFSSAINSTTQHGIIVNANDCVFTEVSSKNYSGNNWHTEGLGGGSNANNCKFLFCEGMGGTRGWFATGADANNLFVLGGNWDGNARWGIDYDGFLQATIQCTHNASNGHTHGLNKTVVTHGGQVYFCLEDNGPASTVIEPGVTSGWAEYWQLAGITPVFSSAWNNSTNYYDGGGYKISDPNASVSLIDCYVEIDQVLVKTNGRTLIHGGELSVYAKKGVIKAESDRINVTALQATTNPADKRMLVDPNSGDGNNSGFVGLENDGGIRWGIHFAGLEFAAWGYANLIDRGMYFVPPSASSATNTTFFGNTATPNGNHGTAVFRDGIHMGVDGAFPSNRYGYATVAPSTGWNRAGSFLPYAGTSDKTIAGFRNLADGTPGTWVTEYNYREVKITSNSTSLQTLKTFTIADNTSGLIEYEILIRIATATAIVKRMVRFQKLSGTLTISDEIIGTEWDPGNIMINAEAVVSSNNLVIQAQNEVGGSSTFKLIYKFTDL